MTSYRFYLRNRDNVIIGSGGFDAEDEAAAIRIVRVRSAALPQPFHSYELLQDNKVVFCESVPGASKSETHD
jgi:hypothetical protein